MTLACESALWMRVMEIARKERLDQETVARLYRESLLWADHILAATR